MSALATEYDDTGVSALSARGSECIADAQNCDQQHIAFQSASSIHCSLPAEPSTSISFPLYRFMFVDDKLLTKFTWSDAESRLLASYALKMRRVAPERLKGMIPLSTISESAPTFVYNVRENLIG